MLDWDDLRSFLAIARHRTLSAAARALSVQQSTMGRRLDALESRTGAKLLQKTPAGFVLTAAGEAVLAHVERMEAEALAVDRAITGRDLRLAGAIRLTTIETLAVDVLAPTLADFAAAYPHVTLELDTDTRSLSLSKREADVALRLVRPSGHELVVRKVGEIAYGLFASPAYLARAGMPDLAAGAPGHRAILTFDDLMSTPEMDFARRTLSRCHVGWRSNSRFAQARAAELGLGIAVLALYLAEGRDLVRLASPGPPRREMWLAVHEDMRHTPRIRAFSDMLVNALRQQAGRLLGD